MNRMDNHPFHHNSQAALERQAGIRWAVEKGVRVSEIARAYGISGTRVRGILHQGFEHRQMLRALLRTPCYVQMLTTIAGGKDGQG